MDNYELDSGVVELPKEVAAPADATPESFLDWVYEGAAATLPAQCHDFMAIGRV